MLTTVCFAVAVDFFAGSVTTASVSCTGRSGTAAATGAPVAAAVPERPVQETEAVVSEPSKKSTAATAKQTVVSKRAEPPANAARPTAGAAPASARRDQPPPLTSTWPASASPQPPAGAAPPSSEPASSPRGDEPARVAQEPPRAPEPPQHTFEELVIARRFVIGLQTENRISSETARVEDRVDARVTRDVRVGDRVAIPAGLARSDR